MPSTILLRVTREFEVLVDMEKSRVVDVESKGDEAVAIHIPGSVGEQAAIAILKRDKRFRLR